MSHVVQVQLGRWMVADPAPFASEAEATERALTLSALNPEVQYRVVVPDQPLGDRYTVFMNGMRYDRVGDHLLAPIHDGAALDVLDILVGGRENTGKLGLLVGRWAGTAKRLQMIIVTARQVIDEGQDN